MSFHEVRFPLALALGATGGPERMTDVAQLASGAESRNARWRGSRRRWEAGGASIRADQAHAPIAFFEARGGRLHGFRFRDPVDWKSCAPSQAPAATDQPLGTGDGETTQFQLVKRYANGGAWWDRTIAKPVEDTVLIAINVGMTTAFEVDLVAGLVTFDAAPADGAVLTAGFEFDVPVRFDADRLEVALVGHDAVRVTRAPLVEIAG
ncbi:MAG TPA: DUF2460 domain-containing protein [Hyphomonadaceae bacterium]|jgi:uncharacterized protein (TIGR02217 family)|nr:DUF2460 domain-containing protein [Hyphomonadaceae bacterium]